MARPSRWMQFTNNFNAMSQTFDDAFKNYEVNKIKKQDYFEDEDQTVKLKGDALRSAQFADIANVYEKYGDMEGAMKLRTSDETLQGLMRDNRIGAATEEDQIYMQGIGAKNQLDASIAASNASTGANNAATALSNLQIDAAELSAKQNTQINSIFEDIGNQDFNNAAEEQAYTINALRTSGLPPGIVQPALEAFGKFGSDALAIESNRILGNATEALRSGNMNDFVNFYNEDIADGVELKVTGNSKDGFKAVVTDKDGKRQQIGQAGSEAELLNIFASRVKDPMTVLGGAVDNLAYRQSKANLEKTQADTGLVEKQGDMIDSNILVNDEQIKQITASIKKTNSEIEVNDAQIKNLNKDLDIKDARVSEIIANTVFVEGVKTDQIRKEIQNINSQISSRGVGDSLSIMQRTLVAAQAAETKAKTARLDPERKPSEAEREEQLRSDISDLSKKLQLVMAPPEEQEAAIAAYIKLMADAANITIEQVTE